MLGSVLIAVVLFGVAAALTVRAIAGGRLRALRQLEQIGAYGFAAVAGELPADDTDARRSWIAQLGGLVAPRLDRERLSATREKLLKAGLHGTSTETYLGYRALSLVGLPLACLWLMAVTAMATPLAVLVMAMGLTMGWLVPPTLVSRRARLRAERVEYDMPELVDLLVVGVEAGMGFNGSMRIAATRMGGPLGEEILLVLRQQSLGASMTEALQNMLDRSDAPAMLSFVRTIVQGERLGVSIGQMLRTIAEDMRKRRKANAEEKANKTPVKILIPLVFMILPAMFIVLLTPAVINIVRMFSGT